MLSCDVIFLITQVVQHWFLLSVEIVQNYTILVIIL